MSGSPVNEFEYNFWGAIIKNTRENGTSHTGVIPTKQLTPFSLSVRVAMFSSQSCTHGIHMLQAKKADGLEQAMKTSNVSFAERVSFVQNQRHAADKIFCLYFVKSLVQRRFRETRAPSLIRNPSGCKMR
ncbi:uncharacterized protein LOC116415788 [Nasonia vitripennis]|uniref:Uncharacterized protein n=1 Tax=Nasonia vitripennis TaxID=7425 RepID=A0A7M7PX87_NASVI|nr:uncharacterized protein LOC116415788 [Nasonia vitripennis]